MRTRQLAAFWAFLLTAIAGGFAVAAAHSFPSKETPAAGQTLTTAPTAISIEFDAPIEGLFARLEVVGADGRNRAVGAPEVSADGHTLSVKLSALTPGEYTVNWAVVCIDTHHTNGSYGFTVAGGGS